MEVTTAAVEGAHIEPAATDSIAMVTRWRELVSVVNSGSSPDSRKKVEAAIEGTRVEKAATNLITMATQGQELVGSGSLPDSRKKMEATTAAVQSSHRESGDQSGRYAEPASGVHRRRSTTGVAGVRRQWWMRSQVSVGMFTWMYSTQIRGICVQIVMVWLLVIPKSSGIGVKFQDLIPKHPNSLC